MKRFAPLLFTASLLAPFSAIAAAPSDAYADLVVTASNQSFHPENAIGAPDQVYLDFFAKDATVTLDMGAGEEGTGDLTLHFKLQNFGAGYRVEFMDASFAILQASSANFPLSQTSVVVAYSGAAYRYVRVTSVQENQWSLDAIGAATVATAPPENPPPSSPPPEEPSSTRGLLVKLPDDGNLNTDVDSAVYVIGADGKRHAFPTLSIYRSWYADFSNVAIIDAENLASYALGANVTVRPGTWLVKIVTDPKVYAVEPGGVLRWVPSETVAVSLFGNSWATRVIDIPDVFYRNYVVGPDLNDQAQPDGTIGALPSSGHVVYVKDAVTYTVPSLVAFGLQSQFLVPISSRLESLYTANGALTDQDVRYPY